MSIRLPSHNIPLSLVADVLCYININPLYSIQDLKKFTGRSDAYVRSCLNVCQLLKIIDEDGNVNPFVNELGKTPSDVMKCSVMRKFIQEYEPFIIFIQYHLGGTTLDEAARKVYVLYEFEGKDYLFLKKLFLSWGETTEIFSYTANDITLTESVRTQINDISTVDINLDNDMAIRMYISDCLSIDIFSAMSSIEINELVNAYKKYPHDARASIECAGRAFEDFLRRMSDSVGVDVSRKNGIGQVVNALYNNKDALGNIDNKIHAKQSTIGAAIGDIRNMAGHSLESRTMERWNLTSQAAKNYVELVLLSIRSIYSFIQDSRYIF